MNPAQQNKQSNQNNPNQGSQSSRSEEGWRRDAQRGSSGDYRDPERGYSNRDLSDYDDRDRSFSDRDTRDTWPSGGYDAGIGGGDRGNSSQRDADSNRGQRAYLRDRSQSGYGEARDLPQFGQQYGAGYNRGQYGGIQSDRSQYGSQYGESPYGGRSSQDNRGRYGGSHSGQNQEWESGIRGGRSSYNAGVDSMWSGGGQSFNEDRDGRGNYDRNGDWQAGQQSGMQSGMHRGKGPKGYQRSDERITEDVSERLSDHSEIDASNIEVKVQQGEVTLSGSVQDRNAKRMAEDIAEAVSGVKDVNNQIRVSQDGSRSEGSRGGQSHKSENESSSSSSGGKKQDQHEATTGKR